MLLSTYKGCYGVKRYKVEKLENILLYPDLIFEHKAPKAISYQLAVL